MNRPSIHFTLCFILPLLGACELEVASSASSDTSTAGCPSWKCGTNSAEVSGVEVGDLNLDGLAGNGDFRIVSATNGVLPIELNVVDGVFQGKPPLLPTLTGEDMEGTVIVLKNVTDLTLHALVIDDFGYVPSWTNPGFSVPAYQLLSAHVDPITLDVLPPYENVCDSTLDAQGLGLFSEYYAVLINGERYDPYTKTVSATGTSGDRWFNIGCNGTALAKMKLMGYDPTFTDTATTQVTTVAQRQATLKMITAAYCPSGMSFTVSGQPLRWENQDGTVTPAANVGAEDTPEAIFTDQGALCLDVPRRASANPDIMDAITAECGAALPSCATLQSDWQLHGEWRTANPAPL